MSIDITKLAILESIIETCRINERAADWLRAALAHQPATGEPVGDYVLNQPSTPPSQAQSGECTRSHPHEEMSPACVLRTEIARLRNAAVPDAVVRDAERYRFIRDADVSDDLIPDIALYAMESLDEYIDAAMLAATLKGDK